MIKQYLKYAIAKVICIIFLCLVVYERTLNKKAIYLIVSLVSLFIMSKYATKLLQNKEKKNLK